MPGKLRVLHFHAEHEGRPVPDIFRGQLDATGQQVTELAELTHGIQQAGTQPVHMGTALGRGDQVYIGFLNQITAFRQPGHRPVHRLGLCAHGAVERLLRYALPAAAGFQQVFDQAIIELPGVALAGELVIQRHQQTRAKYRLRPQQVLEASHRHFRRVEILGVGPEAQNGAGVALANRINHFQVAALFAITEFHAVQLTITLDQNLQLGGQGVHHGHTHTVQATAKLVVVIGELAAGVQGRQDHFHTRFFLYRMHVHGHAAAIVFHFHAAILEQGDLDRLGMAGQRFIHRVIDDFLGKVIGAGGIGVHARALTHRVQARQHFNIFGRIVIGHRFSRSTRRRTPDAGRMMYHTSSI